MINVKVDDCFHNLVVISRLAHNNSLYRARCNEIARLYLGIDGIYTPLWVLDHQLIKQIAHGLVALGKSFLFGHLPQK